jgi:hypothetical protein
MHVQRIVHDKDRRRAHRALLCLAAGITRRHVDIQRRPVAETAKESERETTIVLSRTESMRPASSRLADPERRTAKQH